MAFFLAGGFPMVFVTVFGLVALASAVRFALAPAPGRVGPIVAYGVAVALVSIAGALVDAGVVLRVVAQSEENQATILLVGLSESLAPPILGFSLVAVVALVTAVGLRRT
ncbi:MAG: hypothetical protein ABMA64_31060 [Myxococcota bacterium]